MTFWVTVAARPPHSTGQLIAAHCPSLSLRCHARRRSIPPVMPCAPGDPSGSPLCSCSPQSARNFGRFSSSHPRNSSRNAMSSAVWAKSMARTYHDAHVRFRGQRASRVVDFTFNEDQEELRRAVRAFMERESPSSYMRAMIDDERGFTDAVWDHLVDLGWTALLVPEADGGLGLGLVDLVVVMEEMGRVTFPGPYFSSAVTATLAATHLGLHDQLASLAAGTTRGTIAL